MSLDLPGSPGEGSQAGFPEEVEVLNNGHTAVVAAVFKNLSGSLRGPAQENSQGGFQEEAQVFKLGHFTVVAAVFKNLSGSWRILVSLAKCHGISWDPSRIIL